MFTVEAALEVEVSAETAFDTLADHDSWPRWMPGSFKPVGASVGALEVGKVPRVRIAGMPFTSALAVTVAHRPRELTWTGGLAGVIQGEHHFFFEPTPGGCRVRSSETWTGWLAALVKPIVAPMAQRVGAEQLAGLRKGALERAARQAAPTVG